MLDALETPPGSSDPFFWADFVELRALIHPDHCFSRGDIAGLERRRRDTGGHHFSSETCWRDLINFAGVRAREFGASYPFSVSGDEDTLVLALDGSREQITYLQLLLASLMRHVPETRRAELARHFEQICLVVFERLMPGGAEVRATWAHGGAEASYTGNLFEKMQQIARDLRCTANFQGRDFKTNDSGDGGIDLISWHSMADDRPGMPIAFAQCSCSKSDWRFKHLEASPAKHYRHLPTMHPWATYYFLPIDLRHADGGWAYESDIGSAIIVDRLRLVRLASQHDLYAALPALTLLDDVRAMTYA